MNRLELSKSQKKIARRIIETGLMREYKNSIEQIDRIIAEWKAGNKEIRDTYMRMYSAVSKNDKHIGRRYNGMSGSNYLWIIAGQLADGIIGRDEIADFNPEVQESLIFMSRIDEA